MITSPTKRSRWLLAAALLAGVSLPALGQDVPESLLPPGFDDPVPAPAPAPRPAATPRAAANTAPAPTAGAATVLPGASNPLANESVAAIEEQPASTVDLRRYELPEFARHSLGRVGITAAGNAPFPVDALGSSDGRYLSVLLKRMNAPIASRWASIALRRALMSPLDTPRNVNGADFAADRAWVLLRMGEANAARAVINNVDPDNYTGWLYQVAMQSALASADPAQLCPVVDGAVRSSNERGWALARAICAGLAGKPSEAGPLLSQAQRGTSPSDIDNLLAEKVMGSGAQGRRAVTVEWNGVSKLTAWRFGMASAMGEEIPADLYATAGPQVRYWRALLPTLPAQARATVAESAASSGVFSNEALVDLYSEIEADPSAGGSPEASVARDLRTAYNASGVGERVEAITRLWDQAQTPRTAYARLILTARAAAWIPATAKVDAPEKLIASMLSAGLESAAMEWRGAVDRGSEGWALLTLADAGESPVAYADFESFANSAGQRKAQLMLASLAGLGRLNKADAEKGAQAFDVPVGAQNRWTRAIDTAGQRGAPATVAILAGVGMQSRRWDQISPEALFHILAAFKAAGLGNYARMIAVEAISRA